MKRNLSLLLAFIIFITSFDISIFASSTWGYNNAPTIGKTASGKPVSGKEIAEYKTFMAPNEQIPIIITGYIKVPVGKSPNQILYEDEDKFTISKIKSPTYTVAMLKDDIKDLRYIYRLCNTIRDEDGLKVRLIGRHTRAVDKRVLDMCDWQPLNMSKDVSIELGSSLITKVNANDIILYDEYKLDSDYSNSNTNIKTLLSKNIVGNETLRKYLKDIDYKHDWFRPTASRVNMKTITFKENNNVLQNVIRDLSSKFFEEDLSRSNIIKYVEVKEGKSLVDLLSLCCYIGLGRGFAEFTKAKSKPESKNADFKEKVVLTAIIKNLTNESYGLESRLKESEDLIPFIYFGQIVYDSAGVQFKGDDLGGHAFLNFQKSLLRSLNSSSKFKLTDPVAFLDNRSLLNKNINNKNKKYITSVTSNEKIKTIGGHIKHIAIKSGKWFSGLGDKSVHGRQSIENIDVNTLKFSEELQSIDKTYTENDYKNQIKKLIENELNHNTISNPAFIEGYYSYLNKGSFKNLYNKGRQRELLALAYSTSGYIPFLDSMDFFHQSTKNLFKNTQSPRSLGLYDGSGIERISNSFGTQATDFAWYYKDSKGVKKIGQLSALIGGFGDTEDKFGISIKTQPKDKQIGKDEKGNSSSIVNLKFSEKDKKSLQSLGSKLGKNVVVRLTLLSTNKKDSTDKSKNNGDITDEITSEVLPGITKFEHNNVQTINITKDQFLDIIKSDKPLFKFEDKDIDISKGNKVYYKVRCKLEFPETKNDKLKKGIWLEPIGEDTIKTDDPKTSWALDYCSFKQTSAAKEYDFSYHSTIKQGYAEVKNGTVKPDGSGEKWEAMGGEPVDETDYLAVGGDAYSLDFTGDVATDTGKNRRLTINVTVDQDWGSNTPDKWGWQMHSVQWNNKSKSDTKRGSANCWEKIGQKCKDKKNKKGKVIGQDCTDIYGWVSRPSYAHASISPDSKSENTDDTHIPNQWCHYKYDRDTGCNSCGEACVTAEVSETYCDIATNLGVLASTADRTSSNKSGIQNAVDGGAGCPSYGYGKGTWGIHKQYTNEFHPTKSTYTFNIDFKLDPYSYLDVTSFKADRADKWVATLDSVLYNGQKIEKSDFNLPGLKYFVQEDEYKNGNGRLYFGNMVKKVAEEFSLGGQHTVSNYGEWGDAVVNIKVDNSWTGKGGNKGTKTNPNAYTTGMYGDKQNGAPHSEASKTAQNVYNTYKEVWNKLANTENENQTAKFAVISDYIALHSKVKGTENMQSFVGHIDFSDPVKLPDCSVNSTAVKKVKIKTKSNPKEALREMYESSRFNTVKQKEHQVTMTFGYNGLPLVPTEKFGTNKERVVNYAKTGAEAGNQSLHSNNNNILKFWDNPKLNKKQPNTNKAYTSEYRGWNALVGDNTMKGCYVDSLQHQNVVNGAYFTADVDLQYTNALTKTYNMRSRKYNKVLNVQDTDNSGGGTKFKCGYMDEFNINDVLVNKNMTLHGIQVNPIIIHNPVSTQGSKILEVPDTDFLDDRYVGEVKTLSDDKIEIYTNMTGTNPTPGARTLFIGKEFTCEVPWNGDFLESTGHGLLELSSRKYNIGATGFINNMDTKRWTAVRYIKFPFAVSYISENGDKVSVERGRPVPIWVAPELAGTITDVAKMIGHDQYKFTILSSSDEYASREVEFISVSKNAPFFATNGDGGALENNTNIEEYEARSRELSGINGNRDNGMYVGDYKAFHDSRMPVNTDLVGFIGGLTIEDTGDYRFSELFKKPVTPTDWYLKNVVKKVDPKKPNITVADNLTALKHDLTKVNVGAKGTKGTTAWDKWHSVYCTVKGPNIADNGKNGWYHELPLTPSKNNIKALQKEPMRPGYSVYMDIETTGNYMDPDGFGRWGITVQPKYYAYNTATKEYKPIDIYATINDKYVKIYDSNDALQQVHKVKPHDIYLRYEKEKDRRSVTDAEQNLTNVTAKYAYDKYVDVPTVFDRIDRISPHGNDIWLGTAELLRVSGNARTYIGCDSMFNDKQTGNIKKENFDPTIDDFSESAFGAHGQRWHFTTSLPSSARFVFAGETPSEVNFKKISDNKNIVIYHSANIKAVGQVWTLEYDGKLLNNMTFPIIPGVPNVTPPNPAEVPQHNPNDPPLVIYSSNKTSANDVRPVGTH